MKEITITVTIMCALGAYMSYPSAEERRQSAMETLSPMAIAQTERSLPIEAYDAI